MLKIYKDALDTLSNIDYDNLYIKNLTKYKLTMLDLKRFISFLEESESSSSNSRYVNICKLLDLSYGLTPPYNFKKLFSDAKSFISNVEDATNEYKILSLLSMNINRKLNKGLLLSTYNIYSNDADIVDMIFEFIDTFKNLIREYDIIYSNRKELLKLSIKSYNNIIEYSDNIHAGEKTDNGMKIYNYYISEDFLIRSNFFEYLKDEIGNHTGKDGDVKNIFGNIFYPQNYI